MNIDTRTEPSALNRAFAGHPPHAQIRRHPPTDADRLTPGGHHLLKAALLADSELRPEVVARARLLASDPDYPSREVIDELARLFTGTEDLSELP